MAQLPGKVPRTRPGLARKAVDLSAARLHSGSRTSPRRASPKSNLAGATGTGLLTDNSSQLIAESQSLLSPGNVETGGVPTESQLTMGSDFLGMSSGTLDDDFAVGQDGSDSDSSNSKSSSSGDAADPDDAAEHGDVDAEEFEKFINNNDNENDDVDVGAMNEGLDDLNDYSLD